MDKGDCMWENAPNWPQIPKCESCGKQSDGTYGHLTTPLCVKCRDANGFCGCGDTLKNCEVCKASVKRMKQRDKRRAKAAQQ